MKKLDGWVITPGGFVTAAVKAGIKASGNLDVTIIKVRCRQQPVLFLPPTSCVRRRYLFPEKWRNGKRPVLSLLMPAVLMLLPVSGAWRMPERCSV